MSFTTKISLMLLVYTAVFFGCATDQAAKIREVRPTTVGIWGAGFRPNSKVGVVANAAGLVSRESHSEHVEPSGDLSLGKGTEQKSQNISIAEEQKIDVGLHAYPMATSGFFYGAGFERKRRVIQFDAHTKDSSLTDPSYANVGVEDHVMSVGPAIGWDWIWPNGVSLLTDFGPRWQVSKSRTYQSTGEESNVDVERRDALLKKIDNKSAISLIDARVILGYSF